MRPRQDAAVEVLRLYLEQRIAEPITLEGYPDVDSCGPDVHRPCDAIFVTTEERFAVEHTSIDSFQDQRRSEARVGKVMVPLEERLGRSIDYELHIFIDAGIIASGQPFNELTDRIEAAVWRALPDLPWETGTPIEDPDVPFPLHLYREDSGGFGHAFVFQNSPHDLERQRGVIIARAIADKKRTLGPYRVHGFRTVLLLESEDLALANRKLILEAFRPYVQGCVPEIDDVYLVRMKPGPPCVCWLKNKEGNQVAARAEPAWPTSPDYPLGRGSQGASV